MGKSAFPSSTAVIALAVALSRPAIAADLPTTKGPASSPPVFAWSDIVRSDNQLSLDFIETDFGYAEYNDPGRSGGLPGVLDSEKGWVPGLSVSASVMKDFLGVHNLYLSGRFSWLDGQTNYWSAPLQQKSGAVVDNLDLRLGKGFDVSPNVMLTPYVGAGARRWTRTLLGPGGYQEVYSHAYAGGGLLLQFCPVSRLVLSASGLVGGDFGPTLSATQIVGGFPIAPWRFPLGNSAIFMAGGSADYAITDHVHANVGLDYVNLRYGKSAVNPFSQYEPHSRTSDVTLMAGLGYAF